MNLSKITFIGAGSTVFAKNVLGDVMLTPALQGFEIALYDIDPVRLKDSENILNNIKKTSGSTCVIKSFSDRKEALRGAKYVVNAIQVGGYDPCTITDFEVPKKYGLRQTIADTVGIGGIFRNLRTIPVMLDFAKDMREVCPDALFLNYTNPMSAVTLATVKTTEIPVVGLCHSIQNTSSQLAKYLGVPYGELKWKAGGINHMSWFVELTRNGQDQYPELKERMKNPELLRKDPVRLDAMKYLGAFVSESSGHFSEYIPYYRKREDLLERHCGVGYNGGTGFYANNWPIWRRENDEQVLRRISGEEEISFESSNEYAAVIMDAMINNTPKVIYGNVANTGLIDNLSNEGVVEVACLIDRNGIHPTHFGRLPEHLAALCRSNMAFFDLAVTAVLNRDKEAAMHALMIDPLTSAVCSLEEVQAMFEELYEAEKPFIAELR